MAGHWERDSEICKQHLDFEPAAWDRLRARAYFRRRTSYPDRNLRRMLPMGDTHPAGDGPAVIEVPQDEVRLFRTEELPGFGVVFSSRPGAEDESYLAYKSGSNRGHFHGDQLAFHHACRARPVAVDHHCSYSPKAGQEHMHNRVAFFTEQQPYLNMDGFERLIAFKASRDADLAVGQVESSRFRAVFPLPPFPWNNEWPLFPLDPPLVYRRSVVFVKNAEAADYFVIRDQYRASKELGAAYCLHVWDQETLALEVRDAGQGGTSEGRNEWSDERQDFAALGVQPGWALHPGRVVKAKGDAEIRQEHYEVVQVEPHRLTVDRAVTAAKNASYLLFRPKYTQQGRRFIFRDLTLFCAHPQDAKARFFPWYFGKAGGQATSGLRLESRGASGQFVTVLYPGPEGPAMESLPDGVRVGEDEVVFAGGLDEDAATAYVTVKRKGRVLLSLTGKELDLNRSQGDVGLSVPNVGHIWGDIPDWLLRQRIKRPDWYEQVRELGLGP
jgi:hypothetical protein